MNRLLAGVITLALTTAIFGADAPVNYDAIIQLGNTELKAGKSDAALQDGQKAIALNAQGWEGYALAGGALMNLKRYQEAADDFSQALQRAPSDKQAELSDLRRQSLLAAADMPAPTSTPSQQPSEGAVTQAEVVLWESIKNSTNPADFQAYLNAYPHGAFAPLALQAIEQAKKLTAQGTVAEEQATLQSSGLALAQTWNWQGMPVLALPTGFSGPHRMLMTSRTALTQLFAYAWLDSFRGEPAISFSAYYYNHKVLEYGQVDFCCFGRIFVTDQSVAFQKDKGDVVFVSPRTSTQVRPGDGHEGLDTYSIYDAAGKRYRFGDSAAQSPFVELLQSAVASFQSVYKASKELAEVTTKPTAALLAAPLNKTSRSYSDAAEYCASLHANGLSGWRLPTMDELINGRLIPTSIINAAAGFQAWTSSPWQKKNQMAGIVAWAFSDGIYEGGAQINKSKLFTLCVHAADR